MEKLELKHLAPYLPYGLKIRIFREGRALFVEDITMNGEIIDYLFEESENRKWTKNIYKPILKPLSDLTKEIEINGEKFVPMDRLEDFIDFEWGHERVEYWKIQKMFEWNIDVFRLIPKGLAIDFNTL